MKKGFCRVLASLLLIIFCITECELVMADERTVRVGIYQMDGFHGYNEYDELEGYCIDYLNVVAGVTGWKYEYVEDSWPNLLQMLKDGGAFGNMPETNQVSLF